MADEPLRFIKFGKQSVAAEKVVRAEWETDQSGRSVKILLHLSDGYIMAIAYDDPICKRAADLFGFTDEYAAWPKAKASADARHKAELDQKESERRRVLQARQRGLPG